MSILEKAIGAINLIADVRLALSGSDKYHVSLRSELMDKLVQFFGLDYTAFTIGPQDNPYLTRYTLFKIGRQNDVIALRLHKFHRPDFRPELHNHPWLFAMSLILVGGYWEEREFEDFDFKDRGKFPIKYVRNLYTEGDVNILLPHTRHVINKLIYGVPCWTLFLTLPTVRAWEFIDPKGKPHWWKSYLAKVKALEANPKTRGAK